MAAGAAHVDGADAAGPEAAGPVRSGPICRVNHVGACASRVGGEGRRFRLRPAGGRSCLRRRRRRRRSGGDGTPRRRDSPASWHLLIDGRAPTLQRAWLLLVPFSGPIYGRPPPTPALFLPPRCSRRQAAAGEEGSPPPLLPFSRVALWFLAGEDEEALAQKRRGERGGGREGGERRQGKRRRGR